MTIKTVLTSNGYAKVLNAMTNGAALSITHMAISDRETTPVPSMTALDHEVWRGSVDSVAADPNAPQQIIVRATVPAEVGGWTARAIGLFDDDNNLIVVGSIAAVEKIANFVSITLTVVFALNEHEVPGISLTPEGSYIHLDEKGSNGGVATLDDSGKVPESQLPAMPGNSNGAGLAVVAWDMTPVSAPAVLSDYATAPILAMGYGLATTTSTKDYEVSGVQNAMAGGLIGFGTGIPVTGKHCVIWTPKASVGNFLYAANVVLVTHDISLPIGTFGNFMQVSLTEAGLVVNANGGTTVVDAAATAGNPVLIGFDSAAKTLWVKTANAEASFVFPVDVVSPALFGGVIAMQSGAGPSKVSASLSTDAADLGGITLFSGFSLLESLVTSLPPGLIAPTELKVVVGGTYAGVPYEAGKDGAIFVGGTSVIPMGATAAQMALLKGQLDGVKAVTDDISVSVKKVVGNGVTGSGLTMSGTVNVAATVQHTLIDCGGGGNGVRINLLTPTLVYPYSASVGRRIKFSFANVLDNGFMRVGVSGSGWAPLGGAFISESVAVTSGDSVEFIFSEYSPGNFGFVLAEACVNHGPHGNKTWFASINDTIDSITNVLKRHSGALLTIDGTTASPQGMADSYAGDFSRWDRVKFLQSAPWSSVNSDYSITGNVDFTGIQLTVRQFDNIGTINLAGAVIRAINYHLNIRNAVNAADTASELWTDNGALNIYGAKIEGSLILSAGLQNIDTSRLQGDIDIALLNIAKGYLLLAGGKQNLPHIIRTSTDSQTSAFVAVQDGSELRCSVIDCGSVGVGDVVSLTGGVVFAEWHAFSGVFTNEFSQAPLTPTANGMIYA